MGFIRRELTVLELCLKLMNQLLVSTYVKCINILVKNQITDEGLEFICIALKDNHTLTCLNLAYNNIHDDGAKKLGAALLKNKGVSELDLSTIPLYYLGFNHIVKEGTEKLAEVLRNNGFIRILNLGSQFCLILNRIEQDRRRRGEVYLEWVVEEHSS